MLSETMVVNFGNFSTVNHIGGKLGRKGTLKKTSVGSVPKNLIENPLIVRRIKGEMPMKGKN